MFKINLLNMINDGSNNHCSSIQNNNNNYYSGCRSDNYLKKNVIRKID